VAKVPKKTNTISPTERAIRQALRVEYEVGRYRWLNGLDRPPMTAPVPPTPPTPVKKGRVTKQYQVDRVRHVLSRLYPNGVGETPTAAVKREVAAELDLDSRERGIGNPDWTSVARALGRRLD
jgi:hypothetical protein